MATGPLADIRVLDFSWALAGPFATMQLADMGAEVARVEHPGLTETERGAGPFVDGVSSFVASLNRGKKAITLDLSSDAGRDAARRLAAVADVVVESFRPGVMDELGLGYAELSALNRGLVYAAISGFGQTGPRRSWNAVDAVAQGAGGTMSLNGPADGPPMRVGVSVGDTTAGLYLALGILAALRARDQTGRGQVVDVALADAQVAICENAIARYSATGEEAARAGSRHPLVAPFGPFATSDGYVVIANVKDWVLFTALIGRDDLSFDDRFASNEARLANVDALEQEISTTTRTKPTDWWLKRLAETGACSVGPVNSIADLFGDEQVAARGMLVEIGLPGSDARLTVANTPLRFNVTPAQAGERLAALSEDTEAVLKDWAGYGPDDLATLRAAGVVA